MPTEREAEQRRLMRDYWPLARTAVIIGGGDGFTAALAARHVENVVVYEPDPDKAARLEASLPWVKVVPKAVGKLIGTNLAESVETVGVGDLPDCELMEIDAEGAELHILEHLTARPRSIVVEYHGWHGCSLGDVKAALLNLGYHIAEVVEERSDLGHIAAVREP